MYGDNNTIILKFEVVGALKKMNQSYPKNQMCYDEHFIFRVMKAIFTKKEMIQCAKSQDLRALDFSKRTFAKGKHAELIVSVHLDNGTTHFCPLFTTFVDLFFERIGQDLKRMRSFREHVISIANRYHNSK